jgi:hypothetical protein
MEYIWSLYATYENTHGGASECSDDHSFACCVHLPAEITSPPNVSVAKLYSEVQDDWVTCSIWTKSFY